MLVSLLTHNPMKRTSTTSRRVLVAALCLGCWLPLKAAEAAAAEPVAEEEKPKWETSAGFALTYARGNTENLLFVVNLDTSRKWEKNEIALGASGGYGESQVTTTDAAGNITRETQKNTDFARAYGQYNRLFSDKLYGYVNAKGLHDDIANVMYRATLSPGVGYYFIKKKQTTLDVEIGPGYVWERKYDEVRNDYDNNDYATIRFGQKFQHKFGDRARVWESLEYLPQITDFGRFILNFEVGAEADLTKKLAIRVVCQDTYDSDPAPGRKNNDIKILTGIQYKF